MPARIPTPEELKARGNVPRHVAIIMDGNGRWAKARGVPRLMGHRAGREAVREAVRGCTELGVEVRVGAPVEEIEVEGGRAVAVRTAGGERLACAAVVSNADPATVYTKLVARRHRRDREPGRVLGGEVLVAVHGEIDVALE